MKWTLINSPLDDNFCECFGCSWLSLSLLSLLRHQDKYNINNTFDWSALRAAGPRARCHPFTPSALQDYYFFLPHKHFVSYNRMAQNKTGEKLLPIETSVKKKEIRPFLVEPLLFYWVVDNLSIFQVVRPLWQHSDRCALFTLNSKASWLFVIDTGHVYIRASDVWSLYNVATPIVPSNKKRWKQRSALRYLSSFRSSLLVGYRQNFTSLVPTTCAHLKRNSRRAGRFNSCVSIYLPPPPTFGCRKMSSFSSFTTLQKNRVCMSRPLSVRVCVNYGIRPIVELHFNKEGLFRSSMANRTLFLPLFTDGKQNKRATPRIKDFWRGRKIKATWPDKRNQGPIYSSQAYNPWSWSVFFSSFLSFLLFEEKKRLPCSPCWIDIVYSSFLIAPGKHANRTLLGIPSVVNLVFQSLSYLCSLLSVSRSFVFPTVARFQSAFLLRSNWIRSKQMEAEASLLLKC